MTPELEQLVRLRLKDRPEEAVQGVLKLMNERMPQHMQDVLAQQLSKELEKDGESANKL